MKCFIVLDVYGESEPQPHKSQKRRYVWRNSATGVLPIGLLERTRGLTSVRQDTRFCVYSLYLLRLAIVPSKYDQTHHFS